MKVSSKIVAIFALGNAYAASAFSYGVKSPTFGTALQSSRMDSGSSFSTNSSPANGVRNGSTGPSTGAIRSNAPSTSSPSGMSGMTSRSIQSIWDTNSAVTLQGSTLKTWSFSDSSVQRVQILMKTEGRPLNADVELWQGPDNTPQKMRIYLEDGNLRPFCAIVESPRGSNAIAIRNTNSLEFPLQASVEGDKGGNMSSVMKRISSNNKPRVVQGGAVHTYPFAPAVDSVQIVLATDGRPLNARVELLQGPNNIKQVMELYTEDGLERPFVAIIETPGTGNVVRVVNTATIEYPLTASVEPYSVRPGADMTVPFMGTGGNVDTFMNRPW